MMRKSLTGTFRPGWVLKWIGYLLLFAWFATTVYPIVYLFLTSLMLDPQILADPFSVPRPAVVDNYVSVITGTRSNQSVLSSVANSIVVTCGSLALLLGTSSLAGYALARGHFPGNQAAQQIFLLAMAVPAHVLLIPIYFLFGELGLLSNLVGLMLLYATLGLPFTTLLMRAYFVSFPKEIEEAARLDGCSQFAVFWRIVMPISKGAMATMAIINIGWIWSELFFALILLGKPETRTLPFVIASYQPAMFETQNTIGSLFAILALATLPMIIIYVLFQKQIRSGMTAGAVK